MTSKIRVSEIFYSLEGEGPYTGYPTLFVRLFGCNLTCPGFGVDRQKSEISPLTYIKPESVKDLDTYTFSKGCDSAYSWHPSFKHLAKDYTVEELAEEIYEQLKSLPRNTILSFTGGEPLLYGKQLVAVLQCLDDKESRMPHVLIETNGTLPAPEGICDFSNSVTFAISPKLSASGEPDEKTHNVKAVRSLIVDSDGYYFKFVTDGSSASIEEIFKRFEDYIEVVDERTGFLVAATYLMPEGATEEQQQHNKKAVSDACLKHGFIFCQRMHVWLYGNTIGT